MTDAASALARTDQLEQLLSASTAAFLPGSGGPSAGGGAAGTVPSVTAGAPSFASVLAAMPAPAAASAAASPYPQYATSAPTVATAVPASTIGSNSAPASVPASGGYLPLIQQAAARYGIDPAMLYGVIRQESAFDPSAVSSAGAEGLAQIMPENFASLGITNPFDPAQSVDGGAKMLAENLKTFGGNESDALAAYNAGVGAVQRYGGVPPYAETQNYVQQVLGYAAQYPGAGGASASYPPAAASLLPELPAPAAAAPIASLPAVPAPSPYPTVGTTPTQPGAAPVAALPDATVEDAT